MITTIILLARNGDIINFLPAAYHLSKTHKVQWIVSRPFDQVLDGCSYVSKAIWPKEEQDTLPEAIAYARRRGFKNIRVPQVWKNPERQDTLLPTYQMEAYRLAGMLDEWNKHPLIFDQRDKQRENELCRAHIDQGSARKTILVATEGVSGPFPEPHKLLAKLRGIDAEIVDLSHVRAERVYDLLALYDAADCLVTIDTLHLHLARASTCPVIALMREGFEGAKVPPPQTVASFSYGEAVADLDAVVNSARRVIEVKCENPIIVADVFGQTDRHLRARANWPDNVLSLKKWGRDTKVEIGNDRTLPYFKDMLRAGLQDKADAVIWMNDDCSLAPGAVDTIRRHCAVFGFGCVRRDPTHIGRESFFFSAGWLRAHLEEMPDVIIAVDRWDLVIARWLRNFIGIRTTNHNLMNDFFPAELPPGLILHEDHPSTWVAEAGKSPASIHNNKIWEAME